MASYTAPTKNEFAPSAPPKVQDVLAGIFEKAKQSTIIPGRPYDAAWWWIDHQEPPNEFTERVEQVSDSAWKTPYIDRIAGTLRIFLGMGDPQQAFIVSQIKQGTPWRGDSIEMYKSICSETSRMKEDKAAYIANASGALQELRKQGVL